MPVLPFSAASFWARDEQRQLSETGAMARNVGSEYVAIGVNALVGVVLLPFNIRHLGASAYGLWVLVASVTTYFSILDLGYGSAQVKFAAECRARRDAAALNEIASTLFFLFLGIAVLTMTAAAVLAAHLDRLFRLKPDEVAAARLALLIVSTYVALGFPFSVFGAIVNGFQRFYLNNIIAIATALVAATVNYAILSLGFGLVPLVAATTAVRLLSLVAYWQTARATFPLLSIRLRHVRRVRLVEISAFSVFLLIIDVAAKINYASDTMVIGVFLGTASVAVWSVAARLIDVPRLLSGGLGRFLFPSIVDNATRERRERLQLMLIHGTRLSLAAVVPLAWVVAILSGPAIAMWVGPRFAAAEPIVWVLAGVTTIRVGASVAQTVLKGSGQHRLAAGLSLANALANLALSVVFVAMFGLVGVAFGTLVPAAVISCGIVFPAACRRVGLPLVSAVKQAVWPAVWPMAPAALALWLIRPSGATQPLALLASAIAAGGLYLVLLLGVALDADDRAWYFRRLLGRRFEAVRKAVSFV